MSIQLKKVKAESGHKMYFLSFIQKICRSYKVN